MSELIKKLELEISKTPTGELRNLLCDVNIALQASKSKADIIHAFTSGHNKAKMGLTHSDALIEYKKEQLL